jgi:hypothetical protein
MSSKSPRIAELIRDCSHARYSPHYIGYFKCFNAGYYYEAHDVLEELWLAEGKTAENCAFYKGLIQIAGGFVHMKLHYAEPAHRVHGQRLDPAARLLRLGIQNTSQYPDPHLSLNISTLHDLCHDYLKPLAAGHYRQNPWDPTQFPQIQLLEE